MTNGLRIGTAADLDLVVDLLVEAFEHDPLIEYMFGGHPDPDGAHRAIAAANLRYNWIPYGEIVISDDERGAMLWRRPDASAGPSRWDELRSRRAFFQAVGLRRGLRLRSDAKRIGPRHPTWARAEVAFIGVGPASQGRGLGTRLLRHAVETCDAQQAGMFLETGNERNLPLYKRFGFTVVDKVGTRRAGEVVHVATAAAERGMTTPVIRRATADDIGLVTDILVDAFADDPLINYVLPPGLGGPRLRRRRRRAEIENDYLPRGAEILLDQEERGALIRERPAGPKPPALSAYRYRLDFLRALGWRRGLRMEREWHPIERKHPTWPHVYIGELGVRREHQGQGIGSALLAAGLEPCKTLGVGAYLVTSNPANLPLYRRFGFELVDETRMGRNGPIFRSMWRQPQPSGPDRA